MLPERSRFSPMVCRARGARLDVAAVAIIRRRESPITIRAQQAARFGRIVVMSISADSERVVPSLVAKPGC